MLYIVFSNVQYLKALQACFLSESTISAHSSILFVSFYCELIFLETTSGSSKDNLFYWKALKSCSLNFQLETFLDCPGCMNKPLLKGSLCSEEMFSLKTGNLLYYLLQWGWGESTKWGRGGRQAYLQSSLTLSLPFWVSQLDKVS